MSITTNKDFAVPLVGIDSVTKGEFTIQSAHMVWNEDDDNMISMALGQIFVWGQMNPLFQLGKACPLRLQGLVAPVMFGVEKRFVKFLTIKDYDITDDALIHELELEVLFEILPGNLEYLENVVEYREKYLL